MFSRFKTSSSRLRSYSPPYTEVSSGLALTPSQMLELSQSGIPVSSQMANDMFYDGDTSMRVHIDPLDRRGIDVVDAWNLQKSSRRKLMEAHNNDISDYGL